jgi:hypothetical protein
MSPFENIAGAIHDLSYEEKLKLRTLIDKELEQKPSKNGGKRYSLIGLLADEPELADQILESAMVARESRPLRVPETTRD